MENLNTNQSSSKTEKNILIIYNDDCLLHKSSKQHP